MGPVKNDMCNSEKTTEKRHNNYAAKRPDRLSDSRPSRGPRCGLVRDTNRGIFLMRHLSLTPVARTMALGVTLVLCAPVAHAQDVDPRINVDLLQCASMLNSASYIRRASVEGSEIHQDISEVLSDGDFVTLALQMRAWEQAGCDMPLDALSDVSVDLMVENQGPLVEAFNRGELDFLVAQWAEIEPQLGCANAVTDEDVARARHMLENTGELICG
jgi:hypothetical protein